MNGIKSIIKKIPIIGVLLTSLLNVFRKKGNKFPGSKDYWEQRYSMGGTSGSGSYNRLAEFKAEIINSVVKDKNINSVIEFGCGDGNQLTLANYPSYIGLDVSPSIIKNCREKFQNDKTKEFFVYNAETLNKNSSKFKSDLSLSIDVIFHLVEDEVFDEYMSNVFKFGKKYVLIYSSNFNSEQSFHERSRKFTDWVDKKQPNWKLIKQIDNKYKYDLNDPDNTSLCDFYLYERGHDNK